MLCVGSKVYLSLWILFNLIKSILCMHPSWFSGFLESRLGIVVCSLCLYHSFIFLANITFRPEVNVIKLEQIRTEHWPQQPAALMHVMPIRTKAYHRSITPTIWYSSDDQTLIWSLIDSLASSQYCQSPQWCFLHSVFYFIGLSDVDLSFFSWQQGEAVVAVLVLLQMMYCM